MSLAVVLVLAVVTQQLEQLGTLLRLERLEKEMKQAAARLDFERAAALRDRIYQIQTAE